MEELAHLFCSQHHYESRGTSSEGFTPTVFRKHLLRSNKLVASHKTFDFSRAAYPASSIVLGWFQWRCLWDVLALR